MNRIDLRVGLLGPLEVYTDGVPIPVPRGKSAVVLATLALSAGQPVTLSAIEGNLWRHRLPERIRGSLHSHVMRLRRVLGSQTIRTVASGYVLDVDPERVDVLRFRRLVARATELNETDEARSLLHEALRLWRGEPLAGLASEAFEHDEIPLLLEERLGALQRRIGLDLAAGCHADVVAELRDLTGRYPLCEPLWRQLIIALAGCGRQAQAMEAYHELRARLRDDLGVDPSSDLQELYRRLLTGEPVACSRGKGPEPGFDDTRPLMDTLPPAPLRPQQVPADLDRFAGRQVELATLDGLLAEQRPSSHRSLVVALVGTAGAGKTTLAVHWSHLVIDQFQGGQLYADLHGYDQTAPTPPAAVLDTFLRALGTPPERIPSEADARAALFCTATTGRRLLIVVDNARDTDQVRPLLPGPGNLLVVTSRSQLRGLTVRDGAHRVIVTQLPAGDAANLLAGVLGTARATAQPDAVAALVELCGRLPLALTIAADYAARQPGVSLADLVEDLRHEESILDSLATGEDAATDLRAVFSGSYRHLDPEAAHLFRLLSLHPGAGAISLPAAAALAGLTTHCASVHLDRLVAVNLLEHHYPDRYTFHDLLRAYASERAREEEPASERETATERVLDWYIHSAAAAFVQQWYGIGRCRPIELLPLDVHITPLDFASAQSAQDWLEAHRTTLIAATDYAADHQLDMRAYLLAEMARRFLIHGSYWNDLVHIIQIGLPVVRRLADRAAEVDLLHDLGSAKAALRDYPVAIASFQESLQLSLDSGYRHGEALNLHDLSTVCTFVARFDEAIAYASRSREVYRQVGDRVGEANSLNGMAMTHSCLGEQQAAIACCHEALAVLPEPDDVWKQQACGRLLDSLGKAHAALGQDRQAIDFYRRALEAIRGLADRRSEAVIRLNLGRALRRAADPEEALVHWRHALVVLAPLCDPLADDVLAEITRLNGTLQATTSRRTPSVVRSRA